MDEFEIPRSRMISRLVEHYKIEDEKVLQAMRVIPRHFFVPSALKSQSYADNALPIAGNQTISQPYIVAKMTELLEIQANAKILEIGAGSGYQTAILSQLAHTVFAIERVSQLAVEAQNRIQQLGIKNVYLQLSDGTLGLKDYAPYDGILVAAGGPKLPEPLLSQLKIGGKLVIPIGDDQKSQRLIRAIRTKNGYTTEDFGACAFVPLIGEHGWR